ncbi:hypothetical protein V6U81_09355 [Micromonospora sp. CPCC 205711]|uniref:hypothetical protein n=1 Tax=Micromonospora sp. CPCC 205547 TaxID=3122400 RepID=UPI002FEF5D0A
MSETAEGPVAPLLGRHLPGPAYRRVIGSHRAPGSDGPGRGYLFTVALLAGTASMPILAAISAGSATVGSALPDGRTPFLPTPSVGPVIVTVPATGQPALSPTGPEAPVPRQPGDGDLLPPGTPFQPLPVAAPVPPRPGEPGAARQRVPAPPPTTSPSPTPTSSPDPTPTNPPEPPPTIPPEPTPTDPPEPTPTDPPAPARRPGPAPLPNRPVPTRSPTAPPADPTPGPTVTVTLVPSASPRATATTIPTRPV